ncbi:M23 family metallopeptidase [Paenibacillus cisolokensis]
MRIVNLRDRRSAGKRWSAAFIAAVTAVCCLSSSETAEASPSSKEEPMAAKIKAETAEEIFAARKALYDQISAVTHIPWFRLAAIDQYERTMTRVHPKDRKHPDRLIGIFVPPTRWAGPLNPDKEDTNPTSIRVFSGIGRDGNGDGIADPNNDLDLLYSIATKLGPYGHSQEDFSIGLWAYYQNSRAVQRVEQYSKLYETFGKLDLFEHAFPLPIKSDYSYRSTFGMGRSWGGRRIHEGTDLFADYGVPVRSTCYGVIEIKGWNKYGGWRIGIRDLNNQYHYYAHLQGFDKGIKLGDVVRPGQTIGWVGSSGYGKPGTQGKFPPHLHYGIYRDTGLTEWSFDPYPLLKQWEREEMRRPKKKTRS